MFLVLHYAIDSGQINVIDTLVTYGADIDEIDSNGQNISHKCAQYGSMLKVKNCLTIGINIDICSRHRDTALKIAAQMGDHKLFELLVSGGCDTSIRNNKGLNATDFVFCHNHDEVGAFLFTLKLVPSEHSFEHIMVQQCKVGNTTSEIL